MNENSPTGARDMAHSIDVLTLRPPAINDSALTTDLNTSTTSVTTSIGSQYFTSISGFIIMPTDTKNMAPNRSFTGDIIRSICAPSLVSAKMDPITKAPNAAENPANEAAITIRKHNARLTISRVSLLRNLFVFLSRVGIRYIPATNQSTR